MSLRGKRCGSYEEDMLCLDEGAKGVIDVVIQRAHVEMIPPARRFQAGALAGGQVPEAVVALERYADTPCAAPTRTTTTMATPSIREAIMPTSDPVQILEDIRSYLLEGFAQVTIAPLADAKTGSALINILQARRRWAVEVTDTFLDVNSSLPHPLDAIRKWDLIGMLRSAESGSIVRVTTTGLRFI